MKFARKVIIAVDMDPHSKDMLKPLKDMPFLDQCEIHMVHVFHTITYPVSLFEMPMSYPILDDRLSIEQSVTGLLDKFCKDLLPQHREGKTVLRCLFNDDPKWKFSQYVNDEHADLVILATREKHGLFDSSFTQYVTKHTSANVIILKDQI